MISYQDYNWQLFFRSKSAARILDLLIYRSYLRKSPSVYIRIKVIDYKIRLLPYRILVNF